MPAGDTACTDELEQASCYYWNLSLSYSSSMLIDSIIHVYTSERRSGILLLQKKSPLACKDIRSENKTVIRAKLWSRKVDKR